MTVVSQNTDFWLTPRVTKHFDTRVDVGNMSHATTCSVNPESSLELIQRAQAGDTAALEQLLVRYRPRLQRWARGRLPHYARDITDTEDLVQEALAGAVKNIAGFDCRHEWALQAYLRRSVTNRIRDELRRFKSRPQREVLIDDLPDDQHACPLQAAVGNEVFARYEAALEMLGDVEREAVVARLELGCSYQEIAELVNKPSADAARMMVARALARLAEIMATQRD
jgi:RNA polymerase sigma-70 factor (ECF subfamily)